MGKFIDLTGRRFGRLTVIGKAESYVAPSGRKYTKWLCKCECGNEISVYSDNLRHGKTKSCGCFCKEYMSKIYSKHGMARTRIYREWTGIKTRCNNPNDKRYKDYGGRGIVMCDEWKNSFEAFRDWAMANGYRDDLTIERKDVNGNYCPENCCWITLAEQERNRRDTLRVKDAKGNDVCAISIAEENGISAKTLHSRLSKGWDLDKATSNPITEQRKRVLQISLATGDVIAEYESIGDACRRTGTDRSSVSRCCNKKGHTANGYEWKFAVGKKY